MSDLVAPNAASRTDDLIDRLAAQLTPVRPDSVARRLTLGVSLGVAVSVVVMLLGMGLRPDLTRAVGTGMFWGKFAYVLALGLLGLWTVERLARPGSASRRRAIWLAAPLASVILLAAVQMLGAPASQRGRMLMGGSASECPWLILALAVPPLAGLVWALRGLAPTRLRRAGAVAGLAAGGLGGFVYAFHCIESAAPFLALWYTLGIAGAALVGWLIGPRLLRW